METTMPKLEWDESFNLGVPAMDADDKQFFSFINELSTAMMGKADKKQSKKTMISLLNFTVCHMLSEEVMLRKIDYPMFDQHVEEHDKYLHEVRSLYVRFLAEDTDSRILCAEVIAVLTELLQEHIMKVDSLYGEYINRIQPEGAPCWREQSAWI